MTSGADGMMRASLSAVAPGTEFRDGLERVVRGNTGGLIVLGMDRTVESLCTGGFVLDVEFTPTRLRELCKLDGALIAGPRHHEDPAGRGAAGAGPVHPDGGDRHPAPHGGAGQPAGRVPGGLRQPVDAADRAVRGRAPQGAGGLRRDPVARQPGAGHAGAVQAAARRGRRDAVGAGDRGPGDGPRRDGGGAAAGDGAAHRGRDRRVRDRTGHRRAAAVVAAGRTHRGRRAGAGARRTRLRSGADGQAHAARWRKRWRSWTRCRRAS